MAVIPAKAFEGRIIASQTRGGDIQTYTYTVGTNILRIERGETNWPHAKNLVALDTGAVTLLFPHNRSFIRLPVTTDSPSLAGPVAVNPPTLPAPAGVGPANLPGMSSSPQMPAMPNGMPMTPGAAGASAAMPAMPMMPMPGESLELKATGEETNLLGYACNKFEIRQRGEIMEIWATDKLLPFRAWLQSQPPRFGPQMIEEKWAGLLRGKKLFPLLAVLKFENGGELLRFEIKSIASQRIEDGDGSLFLPPADYHELMPLPF